MGFETERLVARDWTLADVEAAFVIYGDPEVQEGLAGTAVRDLEEQRERIQTLIERHRGFPEGMGIWALELKESKEVVGSILLKPLPDSDKVEVGWHLARRHWGHGYATEAGRAALDHGFGRLGLETIYAVAFAWNVRSTKVMERLGMSCLGLTSEFYGRELVMYSIGRPD